MRLAFVLWMTAISLFGSLSYYVGWTHGSELATRIEAADRSSVEPPRPHVEAVSSADYEELMHRDLALPIAELSLRDVRDSFDEGRASGKPYEGADTIAPRGT